MGPISCRQRSAGLLRDLRIDPALTTATDLSLKEVVPLVKQAIASSIVPSTDTLRLRRLQSTLKCLEAWMPNLPSKYNPAILHNVTPVAPHLQRRSTVM